MDGHGARDPDDDFGPLGLLYVGLAVAGALFIGGSLVFELSSHELAGAIVMGVGCFVGLLTYVVGSHALR